MTIPRAHQFVTVVQIYYLLASISIESSLASGKTSISEQSFEELNSFKASLSANYAGMKGYGKTQSKVACMECNCSNQWLMQFSGMEFGLQLQVIKWYLFFHKAISY